MKKRPKHRLIIIQLQTSLVTFKQPHQPVAGERFISDCCAMGCCFKVLHHPCLDTGWADQNGPPPPPPPPPQSWKTKTSAETCESNSGFRPRRKYQQPAACTEQRNGDDDKAGFKRKASSPHKETLPSWMFTLSFRSHRTDRQTEI